MIGSVDVVNEQDVDAVETESAQARFKGAHDSVIGIVIDEAPLRRVDEDAGIGLARRAGLQQAAHLCRQQKIRPLLLLQDTKRSDFLLSTKVGRLLEPC